MLRVTVELIPGGRESGRRTLTIAEIGNIGGAELADYRVELGDEVAGLKIAEIKQYPRWSASIWDIVLRCIAKALGGTERLPKRPTPILELVPTYPEPEGRSYAYVILEEIPKPIRTAFFKNIRHSSVPGSGRAYRHDWTDFVKGQR